MNSSGHFIVEGKIPARLIPITLDLQKKLNSFKEKSSEDINKEKLQQRNSDKEFISLQSEALEDWYGRLNKNNNYPYTSGVGLLDETLACLECYLIIMICLSKKTC